MWRGTAADHKKTSRIARGAGEIVCALTIILLAAVYGSLFARWHYGADLLTHFMAQYLCGALVIGALALGLRHYAAAMAAGLALCVCVVVYAAPMMRPVPELAAGTDTPVTILHVNMRVMNRDTDEIIALIKAQDADVVNVQEASHALSDAVKAELAERYPTQFHDPAKDSYGTVLMTRLRTVDYKVHPLNGPQFTNKMHEIRFALMPENEGAEQAQWRFFSLHTRQPVGKLNAAQRNFEMATAADIIEQAKAENPTAPIILAGDLNTTSYSPFFRRLVENTNMRYAGQRAALTTPTWPNQFRFGLLQIQIDHILYDPRGVTLDDWRTVPINGSDHKAIMAHLRIRSAEKPQ